MSDMTVTVSLPVTVTLRFTVTYPVTVFPLDTDSERSATEDNVADDALVWARKMDDDVTRFESLTVNGRSYTL